MPQHVIGPFHSTVCNAKRGECASHCDADGKAQATEKTRTLLKTPQHRERERGTKRRMPGAAAAATPVCLPLCHDYAPALCAIGYTLHQQRIGRICAVQQFNFKMRSTCAEMTFNHGVIEQR